MPWAWHREGVGKKASFAENDRQKKRSRLKAEQGPGEHLVRSSRLFPGDGRPVTCSQLPTSHRSAASLHGGLALGASGAPYTWRVAGQPPLGACRQLMWVQRAPRAVRGPGLRTRGRTHVLPAHVTLSAALRDVQALVVVDGPLLPGCAACLNQVLRGHCGRQRGQSQHPEGPTVPRPAGPTGTGGCRHLTRLPLGWGLTHRLLTRAAARPQLARCLGE